MGREYRIAPCSGMKIDVKQGQNVTVRDVEGGQVVDFFAEAAGNEMEFLSTGATIDCNESLKLQVGHTIYTNLYRPMFKVLSDDVGEHDLLHPCCRPEMYEFFYRNGDGHPNCLDNINRALMDLTLGVAACSVSESKGRRAVFGYGSAALYDTFEELCRYGGHISNRVFEVCP